MTLNATGKLSLGGVTVGESVDLELSQASNASNSMVSDDNKILTGKATGPWVFPTDWRGKKWYDEVLSDSVNGSTTTTTPFAINATGGRPSTAFTMTYKNPTTLVTATLNGSLDSSGNYTTIPYTYPTPGTYTFSFYFNGSRNTRTDTVVVASPPLVLSWNPTSISDSIFSGPYNSYMTSVLTASSNSAPSQSVTVQETSRPTPWSTTINYSNGNPPSVILTLGAGSTSTVTFGVFPPQGTNAGTYTGSFTAVYNNSTSTLAIPWTITITVSEVVYNSATYNATAGSSVIAAGSNFDINISNAVASDSVSYSTTFGGSGTISLNSLGKYTFSNLNFQTTGFLTYSFTFTTTGHTRSTSIFVYNEFITIANVAISNGSTVTVATTDSFAIGIITGIPNSGFSWSRTGTSSSYGGGALNSSGGYTYSNQSLPQGTYNYTVNFTGTGGSGATRTFTIVSRVSTVNINVYAIGGGGAGGYSAAPQQEGGGGGGAGGLLINVLSGVSVGATGNTVLTIAIGGGGSASYGQGSYNNKVGNGSDTYVITSESPNRWVYVDGGGAGSSMGTGSDGGCGGGASGTGGLQQGGTGGANGAGHFGLIESGQNGGSGDWYGGGGGGGGVISTGSGGYRSGRPASNVGGAGGSGFTITFTGSQLLPTARTNQTYTFDIGGGGGGGGTQYPGAGGNANAGAGGGLAGQFTGVIGINTNSPAGGNAAAAFGCGGGGSTAGQRYGSYTGGNGGSGSVIVSYLASTPVFSGGQIVIQGSGNQAGLIYHIFNTSGYLTSL